LLEGGKPDFRDLNASKKMKAEEIVENSTLGARKKMEIALRYNADIQTEERRTHNT